MINRAFREFWDLFSHLPFDVQKLARGAFKIFKENPQHPSLRFKPLHGHKNVYSVRIGPHYRAAALRSGDTLRWFWIGSHSDFDKMF